jgi:hypothetical protein
MFYTSEVTPRGDAVAAGMFRAVGMLAEAAANENGGLFQVRIMSEKPIG